MCDAIAAHADGTCFKDACKQNGRDGRSRGRTMLRDGDRVAVSNGIGMTDSRCAIEQRR
jgi:hypothetical protein